MVWIALLRAVNVGGRKVDMRALRDMAAGLRLNQPRTLLQSGNLVFEDQGRNAAELEALLEEQSGGKLGLPVEFMVRSADEWAALAAGNPFPEEAERDPGHLLALVLKAPVSAGTVAGLQATIAGREVVRGEGAAVYAYYPEGIGTSKLTNAVIERKLGTRATGRNWNTVLKLLELSRNGG